jgi:hypothetical protein
MHCDASLAEEFATNLWNRTEAIVARGVVLRKTRLRSAVLVEADGCMYVIKHYFPRSLRFSLKQRIIGSQAYRSYRVGRVLSEAGVRTPRPVACIEHRWRGLHRDCFLVYPHVEGGSLRSSINQGYLNDFEIASAWRQLRSLWEQLISLRVGLRDANIGNFIVDSTGMLWLIDLDDCCIHRSATLAHARLQNRWYQLYRSLRRATRSCEGRSGLLAAA